MPAVFFRSRPGHLANHVFLAEAAEPLSKDALSKLCWLLQAEHLESSSVDGLFLGPRRAMITPWSTNATEIAGNVGVHGLTRVESFTAVDASCNFDPMLEELYQGLDEASLTIEGVPAEVLHIKDIAAFNAEASLALSPDEIEYLLAAAEAQGRPFTDAELFGFAQINSEHCRHKIFNGLFVVDGEEKSQSLFSLIKETSKHSGTRLVSAYADNVAFIKGPEVMQFAPVRSDTAGVFGVRDIHSVISLKAETHNFPTTVEPFNGASTGSGGEIRDRMAGGKASIPLAGTAVYMTSYPRLAEGRAWEAEIPAREWKYHSPAEILVKASNGASDFGNKFGQPLTVGSLLTFEGESSRSFYVYDRTVMLAGGIGYANALHAQKDVPKKGHLLLLLGGDNYRIGMAGGSVSSLDSGSGSREQELSAVQRANPEMQKRVYNVIRALGERDDIPVVMIHDHGAGGHINCFSELLEAEGGTVELSRLPVGDPTLSVRELICNESQERMGLIVPEDAFSEIELIAERERAPLYLVGEVSGEREILFRDVDGSTPVSMTLEFLFGKPPQSRLEDISVPHQGSEVPVEIENGEELLSALRSVLSLEAVACKDWLTNKVDRSVTGLVVQQQCCGPLQLPLSNVAVSALDYSGREGIAQALGHAPVAGIVDERAGSRLSVAEALTNIVWAPLKEGLASVALSANWMWPAKRSGENARLYSAVEALSEFAIELGIAVPTGKDSLSMTMEYADGMEVRAPGTVVVTAVAHCDDVRRVLTPDLKPEEGSLVCHLDMSGSLDLVAGLAADTAVGLAGSSFSQTTSVLGTKVPDVQSADGFRRAFEFVQILLREEKLLAGHDISSGGLLSAICEMAFAGDCGLDISLPSIPVGNLFSECPGVLLQVSESQVSQVAADAKAEGLSLQPLAEVQIDSHGEQVVRLNAGDYQFTESLKTLRDQWFEPSFLFDERQTSNGKARERFDNYGSSPLQFRFPENFVGVGSEHGMSFRRSQAAGKDDGAVRAAVVRDKGSNGDREMSACLHYSGFSVLDLTMSDMMKGRVSLDQVDMLVFPGGFTNSDVLGAARGWAGAFRYNDKALKELDAFLKREDSMSLGVCNGCQLMGLLDVFGAEGSVELLENESEKFESSFLPVTVEETASIMLKPLVGSELGIWVAHGEGRFQLAGKESDYDLPLRYLSSAYPANPNGSAFNAAAITSADGRHLAMMPHLERCSFAWQWPYYPRERNNDEISPWMLAFSAARDWLFERKS